MRFLAAAGIGLGSAGILLVQVAEGFYISWRAGKSIRAESQYARCSHDQFPSTSVMCASGAAPQVGLTREAGKNAKLAALLTEAGISSVEIPCIAHEDGPDLPLLPAALQDTAGLAYVVITSPEAAKVFLEGWKAAGNPSGISVACVGVATGQALEKGGITPAFTPSKATGETLAAELPVPSESDDTHSAAGVGGGLGEGATPAQPPPRVVLYPASAKAGNQIQDGLTARGFEVRRLDTYNTVPAEWDAEMERAAHTVSVAAFGSPSAVKTWAKRVGVYGSSSSYSDGDGDRSTNEGGDDRRGGVVKKRGVIAACIGNTSATACRKAGWPEEAIFAPDSPGMDGWAKAVADALAAVDVFAAQGNVGRAPAT